MKFENPQILFWLWALVPVAGIMIYGMEKRKKILGSFASEDMLVQLAPGMNRTRPYIRIFLIVLAMVFALIALADPRMGFRWEKITQRGVDIMIALDCSRSMLAEDVAPSRLERAKREILDLTSLMKADRAGLVAFAGSAFLQCPLTLDYHGFGIFLRVLSPDFLPVGGTNLKAAIETCYSSFDPASDTDKAIILITDGENTGDSLEETAKKMAEKGIRIFAVGVGDTHGAPVPASSGGFIKDASGSIVMSKVDEEGLKKICALTKGHYVRSVAGDMDLDEIYTQRICADMDQKEFEQGRKKVDVSRFQWFLFPCLVLLLMEWFLPRTRRKKSKPMGYGMILVLAMILWGLPHTVVAGNLVAQGIRAFEAQEFDRARTHFIQAQLNHPDDLRLYYNIGTAAYKSQEYDLALDHFAKAAQSSDPELQHRARYNMANALVQKGNLEQARDVLEQLVASFPQDEEAKDNLAWVKKKLEEKEKQQKQSPEKQDPPLEDQKQHQKQGEDQKQNQGQPSRNQEQQDREKQNPGQNQTPKQKDLSSDADTQSGQNQEENQIDLQNLTEQENPSSQKQDQEPQKSSQGAAPGNLDQSARNASVVDAKLNRLEDRPGAALIPRTHGRKLEKDW